MKVILTGSSGLLASTLKKKITKNYKLYEVSRQNSPITLDLVSYNDLENKFNSIKPNIIVNLAANTNLDMLEENFNICIRDNFITVKNIVDYILKNDQNIKFIHLTTDQYYNQKKLNKENEISILNNYTFSKYISEIYASKINSLILRTNFLEKVIQIKNFLFQT